MSQLALHEEHRGNGQTKVVAIHPAQPRVVAIIPAYNEERFIGSVVIQAHKYVDAVIVVDDGSVDATGEVAEGAGAITIRHVRNRGKGSALNTAFDKARELGAEAIALLDGDGQHRPGDIPAMIGPILEGRADMVIGSRYLDAHSDIPAYRRVGQRIVTTLTNACSGVSSTDSWSGFRAFSQRAAERIRFGETGWGVDPELQFQARKHQLRVAEVPIVAVYEEKAKRNPIAHGMRTVNAILRLVGQHRPLFFFSSAGLVSLSLGIGVGLWVVNAFRATQALASGLTMLSVLLSILGALTLTTGFILHSVREIISDALRQGR